MVTIQGIGRLAKEPKMQYTANGSALTNLTVAMKSGFGEKQETIWVDLVSFGKQAETLNQYLSKGKRIAFTAELRKVRTYEKQDHSTGVNLDARILDFEFVDAGAKQDSEPTEF